MGAIVATRLDFCAGGKPACRITKQFDLWIAVDICDSTTDAYISIHTSKNAEDMQALASALHEAAEELLRMSRGDEEPEEDTLPATDINAHPELAAMEVCG